MKYISRFFLKFIPKDSPKPMGRWYIDYCDIKMNRKIDLSNEDRCGPCGQYVKTKIHKKNNSNIRDNILDNKFI